MKALYLLILIFTIMFVGLELYFTYLEEKRNEQYEKNTRTTEKRFR